MSHMTWSGPAFIALVWLWAGPAIAGEPFADARVNSGEHLVVGQQITVEVDVFVPNFFTSAPQFPSFDIANAIVILPEGRAQNLSRTVNGEQYSGIRRTYFVIPQIKGEFVLPPASISFKYADVPGTSMQGTVTLPPTRFSVDALPAGKGATPSFAAASVQLTQTLDRDPATLKVGDTLARTVTLLVQGTQAMMLPAPRFDTPSGVKLYKRDPVLENNVANSTGAQMSKRTDRVTYVTEQQGAIVLPAIAIDWFNVTNSRTEQARLEPLVLKVKAAPVPTAAIAPELSGRRDATTIHFISIRMLIVIGTGFLAMLSMVAILWRFLPRLMRWIDTRREEMQQSETARFRQLYVALNSGDPGSAYRALTVWTRSAGFESVAEYAVASNDENIQDALTAFEKDIFGTPESSAVSVHMNRLAAAILAWRERSSAGTRRRATMQPALPSLNP